MEKQPLSILTVDCTFKTIRVNTRTVLYFTILELILCILFFFFCDSLPAINVVHTVDSLVSCFDSIQKSSRVRLKVDLVVLRHVVVYDAVDVCPEQESWEEVSRFDIIVQLISIALIVLDRILAVRRLHNEAPHLHGDEEARQ